MLQFMRLGLHVAQHLHHPVGQGLGHIPAFPEVQVPAKALGDGDLVGLHELDEGAVGILHVGKMAGGLAHIEGLAGGMDVRIHGEGKSFVGALIFQGFHIQDIEADVDKAQVAPDAVLENLFRCAVQCLHQLDLGGTEETCEGPLAHFAVLQQDSPEPALTPREVP